MKIVKFNRTHKLFQYGYTHGFRFVFDELCEAIEAYKIVCSIYQIKPEPNWRCRQQYRAPAAIVYNSNKGRNTPVFVGVKDEKILGIALLSMD